MLRKRAEAPFVHPIGRAKRYYMVFIYCAVASLLSADQNLMAPNLTCVAALRLISNVGHERVRSSKDCSAREAWRANRKYTALAESRNLSVHPSFTNH